MFRLIVIPDISWNRVYVEYVAKTKSTLASLEKRTIISNSVKKQRGTLYKLKL